MEQLLARRDDAAIHRFHCWVIVAGPGVKGSGVVEIDQNKVGCFLGVRPAASYHLVSLAADGVVTDITSTAHSSGRINGGFMVLKSQIFDYMKEGEELVEEPFRRLIAGRQLAALPYDGFWACMDTFKEKQHLDELYSRGTAPWEVWKPS